MNSEKKQNRSKRQFPAAYEKVIPLVLGGLAMALVVMLLFAFLAASGLM